MKICRHILASLLTAVVCLAFSASADQSPQRSPFGVAVVATNNADGSGVLCVDFSVPNGCVLYQDRLHFRTSDGTEVQPLKMPEAVMEIDKVTGNNRNVYLQNFTVLLNPADFPNHQVAVKFQGCTNDACFFPEQRMFGSVGNGTYTELISGTSAPSEALTAVAVPIDWAKEFDGFVVKGRQTGYLNASSFETFLDRAMTGQGAVDPLQKFQNLGLLATLLLIVAGGFLLNFTPCVLPMIPINLAIIGAGSRAKSRMEGFRNGALYGFGMALAYGTLGLVVVLSGSKFGTLNSSMWFNAAIALVFIVLALGMFDVVKIDLSGFSAAGATGPSGKGVLAQKFIVLFMGIMSALLAGACVAPVVISVVLLATTFYSKGAVAGLLLPFLLGLGMALPWPFAGAGLTFLPKPGKWMKHVKFGFGILILLFAFYYGALAWDARPGAGQQAIASSAEVPAGNSSGESEQELLTAIQQARTSGRPLFIDFHASWCKDCVAMDETVFNSADVKNSLQKFVTARYAAEQPNVAPARPLLDQFNVMGLPTYLVLSLKQKE